MTAHNMETGGTEGITVDEFLRLKHLALKNGPDKPVFVKVMRDIRTSRTTQTRLAFELMEAAITTTDNQSSLLLVADSLVFSSALETGQVESYLANLEMFICKAFSILERVGGGSSRRTPYDFALRIALTALRKMDRKRFHSLVLKLRANIPNSNADARLRILGRFIQGDASIGE
jgi:hypothetical protein